MPYARLDDRYDDHRKIKRALRREPAAVAMHAMAITYSNRHNTDGEVDIDWVEERLALMPYKPAQRKRVLDVLVELNLFEQRDPDTFIVHDFLDWNLSSEQRRALAEQGRKGGRARPGGSSGPGSGGSSNGSSPGLSEGLGGGLSESGNGGLSTPTPRHATPTPRQETRPRRATRQVDQRRRPDDFPDELIDAGHDVLQILHRVWDQRGGVEPQPRGVGLAIMRNPRADHVVIAQRLEHWLTAGKGRSARCGDVAQRFGDWVADADAAERGGTVTPIRSESDLDQHRLAAAKRLMNGGQTA